LIKTRSNLFFKLNFKIELLMTLTFLIFFKCSQAFLLISTAVILRFLNILFKAIILRPTLGPSSIKEFIFYNFMIIIPFYIEITKISLPKFFLRIYLIIHFLKKLYIVICIKKVFQCINQAN